MYENEEKTQESDDDDIPIPITLPKSDAPKLPEAVLVNSKPDENTEICDEITKDPKAYNTLKKCVNTLVTKRKNSIRNNIRTWNLLDLKLECEVIEAEH